MSTSNDNTATDAKSIPQTVDTYVNSALDRLEESLPPLPAGMLRLNRTAAELTCRVATTIASAAGTSAEAVLRRGAIGGRTVTGQAQSAVDRTISTGTDAAKEVAGQVRAQVRQTVEVAEDEAETLADRIDDVEESLIDYSSWTKSELYELAQQRDIDGRASMNKAELISALNS